MTLRLNGQSSDEVPVNFAVWAGYEGTHPFHNESAWRLLISGTAKRNNGITDAQGYLVEGGLGYDLRPGKQVAGGYGIQYNIPFDSASKPYRWTDYRVWEEASFRKNIGGDTTLKQRFTLEQRWQAQKSAPDYDKVTGYDFEMILKYKIALGVPLTSKTQSIFYDEIHLRILPTDKKRFDQNRLFAGLSIAIDREKRTSIEAGYMLQIVRDSSEVAEGRKRTNHTIRITFISESPLKLN
jgi:hypothetical protein